MLTPKCSLLIERPALAAASSITTRPAAASAGVHSEGSHPSDNRPQRSSGAGAVPRNPTSSGCCPGRRESLTSRKLPAVPSWLTVSPAHRRRKSGSASSMKAPRRLGSTPMASRSGAYMSPGTSVTSNRPLHSTCRLASCLARRSTWRPGNSIVVPSFKRGLLAAAQERPTTGSSTGAVSTSESHRESNPRSSRPVRSSASASGVEEAPADPTPMRIFISPLVQHRRAGRQAADLGASRALVGQPERHENAQSIAAGGDQDRRSIAMSQIEQVASGDRQNDGGRAPRQIDPAGHPAIQRASPVHGHRGRRDTRDDAVAQPHERQREDRYAG